MGRRGKWERYEKKERADGEAGKYETEEATRRRTRRREGGEGGVVFKIPLLMHCKDKKNNTATSRLASCPPPRNKDYPELSMSG